MQPARQQTLGLILIALLILMVTLVRFARAALSPERPLTCRPLSHYW